MDLDLTGVTIVFDLDGTLVDTAPDLAAAANHVLDALGLSPLSPTSLRPFISHGSRAMIDGGLRLHGLVLPEAEVARLNERFFAYYAENVAVLSRPFEGVPELLDALLGTGASLAVCTNKLERLSRSLLTKLGLEQRFRAIAGRDTFPVYKPAPAHLTGTIEQAGGDASRAVMVGDSEVDFATAMAANVPSIGVSFGYTARPIRDLAPDAIVDHYREFLAALRQVLRSQPRVS
jgi:phosphoglycolate phosphatase